MTLTLGVLVASLLGSVHCAGMCGAFVCFYSAGSARGTSRMAHVAYNAGRLVSYLALGAVAGTVGAAIEHSGARLGVARAAAIVAGVVMVAWGVSTIAATRGFRMPRLGMTGGVPPLLRPLLQRARTATPVTRAATTGLLTTLLPCGWLYTFVAAAGGTGAVSSAMMTMAVFWAGTLPMMVAVGAGAQRLTGALRHRLPVVTAGAVVVMGMLSIAGHLRHLHPATNTPAVPAAAAHAHEH